MIAEARHLREGGAASLSGCGKPDRGAVDDLSWSSPGGWSVADQWPRVRVPEEVDMGNVRRHAITESGSGCIFVSESGGMSLQVFIGMFPRNHHSR